MAKVTKRKRIKIEATPINPELKAPDFLDVDGLSQYLSERGRILPRTRTGLLASEQRKLRTSVKRARYLALLPFAAGIK